MMSLPNLTVQDALSLYSCTFPGCRPPLRNTRRFYTSFEELVTPDPEKPVVKAVTIGKEMLTEIS
jgi:hypothetical protein